MQTKDLTILARALAPVISEHIKSQRDEIVKSVLADIPKPEAVKPLGADDVKAIVVELVKEPEPVDIDSIVSKAVAAAKKSIVIPEQLSEDDVKRIASGLIAEDEPLSLDDIAEKAKSLIDAEDIAKTAASLVVLPEVKDGENGKDAVIDYDKLDELVAKHVAQFEINEESIVKQVLALVPVPAAPSVPTVEEIVSVVAAQFERRFSDLQLSWERQAADKFEKAIDRMPNPKDGVDAFPLESFDIELGEDGRTLTVKMQAGDSLLSKSIKIPSVIDRGVYKSGEYDKGDGVTYGGSFWIAQESGELAAPGTVEAKSHWRLAVKKGRDGADLRENAATIDVSKGVKIR